MPLTEVTNAIFNFLDPNQGSGITWLGSVYPALPKVANEADLFNYTPPGLGNGAVIYLAFTSSSEQRIELTGPVNPAFNGQGKAVPYDLVLLCIFKSDQLQASDCQVAYNQFEDSLIGRIRSDRNAGDPSVVFQWGEGELKGAAADVKVERSIPKTMDGGVMLFHTVIHITTIEVLQP
jgi:hypothetical protein